MKEVILDTDFKSLKLFKKGKVRDIYELDNMLLIVATDRISAFDVVLPNGIPQKGEILTALSSFWFGFTRDVIANHLIPVVPRGIPHLSEKERKLLEGRAGVLSRQWASVSLSSSQPCHSHGFFSGYTIEHHTYH
jgi:phosphoribosylaminoimidazole-succinocarboxamide synthase